MNTMQGQSAGMGNAGFGNMVTPGNIMGVSPCPYTPCILDQYGQPSGDPSGQSSVKPPCQECGGIQNAPCIQAQGGGMGMNMGMGMGMGMPMGMGMGTGMGMGMGTGMGMGMSGPMTPCIECGNIPNAPCLPPPNAMMLGGFPSTKSNVPCSECAGLENPPCAQSDEPDGNYQEIGASMGGNSLTIRVHKDKNKIEQLDPNTVTVSENSSEAGCCCSAGQPGKKKKKKQNQTFNMRPGVQQGNQDMPFAFRMGKSGNTGNNVVVNPPVATAPDGTKFTEFSDPNRELFILRVGKKSEGIDKKQNLELELCTPRGKAL